MKKKNIKRCVSEDESTHSPARPSVFQRMIACTVARKVRESFAVVKRLDDPYEDFKSSLAEMILEKQRFDDQDLEQLLHCFFSLKSRNHHGDIVRAFIEIYEALFSVGNGSVVRFVFDTSFRRFVYHVCYLSFMESGTILTPSSDVVKQNSSFATTPSYSVPSEA